MWKLMAISCPNSPISLKDTLHRSSVQIFLIIPPPRSEGGYTGLSLSVRPSVRLSVCLSVRRREFVVAITLEPLHKIQRNFIGALIYTQRSPD